MRALCLLEMRWHTASYSARRAGTVLASLSDLMHQLRTVWPIEPLGCCCFDGTNLNGPFLDICSVYSFFFFFFFLLFVSLRFFFVLVHPFFVAFSRFVLLPLLANVRTLTAAKATHKRRIHHAQAPQHNIEDTPNCTTNTPTDHRPRKHQKYHKHRAPTTGYLRITWLG